MRKTKLGYVRVKPCHNDRFSIVRHFVCEREANKFNLHLANDCPDNLTKRFLPPGRYMKLVEFPDKLWMSNVPAEIMDHKPFVRKAKGNVLIIGLGIGMVLEGVLCKKNVSKIIVLDIEKDIIDLVSPFYRKFKKKISFVNGDVRDQSTIENLAKDAPFDSIYIDIWPKIVPETYDEMAILRGIYKKFLSKNGFIEFWCQRDAKIMAQGYKPESFKIDSKNEKGYKI